MCASPSAAVASSADVATPLPDLGHGEAADIASITFALKTCGSPHSVSHEIAHQHRGLRLRTWTALGQHTLLSCQQQTLSMTTRITVLNQDASSHAEFVSFW